MIDFTPCTVNKFKGYGGANGNKINIIYSNFLGFLNNLLFSIFSTFSLLHIPYTNSLPNFLTRKKIIVVVTNTENVINNSPPIVP